MKQYACPRLEEGSATPLVRGEDAAATGGGVSDQEFCSFQRML